MPVRKIPKNYRNLTGSIANSKSGRLSDFESTLERDFYILLDFDIGVSCFEEQPLTIEYRDGIITRRYTPDVLVHYLPNHSHLTKIPALCEVKYRTDIKDNWPEDKVKYRAAIRHAKNRGWRFRLVTEKEIRGTYLDNVKFLRRYRRSRPDRNKIESLVDKLHCGATTPRMVLSHFADNQMLQGEYLTILWHLVSIRTFAINLNEPLTMDIKIGLN